MKIYIFENMFFNRVNLPFSRCPAALVRDHFFVPALGTLAFKLIDLLTLSSFNSRLLLVFMIPPVKSDWIMISILVQN